MKYLLSVAFLSCAMLLFAQTPKDSLNFFEGTIEYDIEMKGPAAQMLNENKPNTKMKLHLKKNSYIVNLYGGMYPKTFLFIPDSNYEYEIDADKQFAYKNSVFNHKGMTPMYKRPPVVNTGKTDTLWTVKGIRTPYYRVSKGNKKDTAFGVPCQILFSDYDSTKREFYVSDLVRADADSYKQKSRAQAHFLIPGMEGRIPLKIISKSQGLQVIQEAKAVSPQRFDPSLFLIPPGFILRKMDRRWG